MRYKVIAIGTSEAACFYGDGTINTQGDYYWNGKYHGSAACNYEQMCAIVMANPDVYEMTPVYDEDLLVDVGF